MRNGDPCRANAAASVDFPLPLSAANASAPYATARRSFASPSPRAIDSAQGWRNVSLDPSEERMSLFERCTFRFGKGNKQRSAPLPLPARQALQAYLDTRPPVESSKVFIGERGPLTEKGVRALCDKCSAFCGFKIHPHLLRHTMAHRFLENNGNDLVALAQILGHENLNTTKRYVQRTEQQLGEAADRLSY